MRAKSNKRTEYTNQILHLLHLNNVPGVYSISCPVTGEVVYIGISANLYLRFKIHINGYNTKHPIGQWLNHCKAKGIVPIFNVIRQLPREDVIFHAKKGRQVEYDLIVQYKSKGLARLNVAVRPVQ